MHAEEIPVSEYAFPGPLRDRLVAAILSGAKTATTSLLAEYELAGEALPAVGDRARVIDSLGASVGIEEITAVDVARLGDVTIEHVVAEEEGHRAVAEWRAGHEAFWHSREFREEMGDPTFSVTDDTLVVLARFSFVAGGA